MSLGIKDVYSAGFSTIDFRSNPRLLQVLKLVERKIGRKPGCKVLDIGCGDGKFALALGEALGTKNLFGIDIASEAARLAQERGLTASVLDVDQENIPFESGSFDVIYCGNLIEVVLDPDHLLREIHRILALSGVLVITFPNLCAWASRLAVLFGYHPYYDRVSRRYTLGKMFVPTLRGDSTGFIRLLTKKSFQTLAGLYGLEAVSLQGATENSLPWPMRPVDKFFSKFPSLAFQIICLARKKTR